MQESGSSYHVTQRTHHPMKATTFQHEGEDDTTTTREIAR
jgi:hypothetical protein